MRDCGAPENIGNVRRRERCRFDLRLHLETYHRQTFKLAWSGDHLKAIARLQEAVLLGALYAFAMPRGSGKTSLSRGAAEWAVSHGHRRYVPVVGSTAKMGEDSLDAIKTFVRFAPEYGEDFPEIVQAVQHLDGIANRAAGQTSEGQPTMIEWGRGRIILPTVRPPQNWPKRWPLRSDGMVPTSGSVIAATGLTGEGLRGLLHALTTGEQIRPDLVLLDDPQTRESSHSPTQNTTREQLVSADVLGMGGPGKTISAVMPCTVISRNDFIDRILDRGKHPLWRGERTKMLSAMPADLDLWEKYFEVYRRCAQLEPPDFTESDAWYAEHQVGLEAGAEASWPERKLDRELSAIQHAMHLYCRDAVAFAAEYQNDPLPDLVPDVQELTADQIAGRVNRHPRGVVPFGAAHLTAFIDVQGTALYYAVCGWAADFTGWVVDYGTWPDQGRDYFSLRDLRRTLAEATGAATLEGGIYAGLEQLAERLLGHRWPGDDGTTEHRVGKCLVDVNWEASADVVYNFCRQSAHAAVLQPSRGKYFGAKYAPMSAWKKADGEQAGLNWRVPATQQKRAVRHVLFDTNFWKSFLHARLAADMGSRGALTLFGDRTDQHRMLADHLTAEYRVKVNANGRTVDEWVWKPGRPDNHWLDGAVGCCVAASMLGAVLPAHGSGASQPTGRKRVSFREMQERARAAKGQRA